MLPEIPLGGKRIGHGGGACTGSGTFSSTAKLYGPRSGNAKILPRSHIFALGEGTRQNTSRKANCMKRGVVSVELYFPNASGA
jgi:hypothetical protein